MSGKKKKGKRRVLKGKNTDGETRLTPDHASTAPAGASEDTTAVDQLLSGRYRLIREIARGGMGIVYEAVDEKLEGEPVAVKVLASELAKNQAAVNRLKREALAARRLSHRNITRLHSFEEDGEVRYLVMELLDGQSLDVELSTKDGYSLDEVLDIARQTVAGLTEAHAHNVVHRDIKPANLMYATRGTDKVLKIADFGIAFEMRDSLSRLTGQSGGPMTLQYAAPEQLKAQPLDARTDQYALAVTLYELLSGRPPFVGTGVEYQIVNAEPQPLADVPAHVTVALATALSKTPSDRFPDCKAFLRALEGEGPVAPAGAATFSTGSLFGLIVVLVAALLGAGHHFGFLDRFGQGPPPTAVAVTPSTVPPSVAPTPEAPVAPPATTKPLPPRRVSLRFSSKPPGAKVFCYDLPDRYLDKTVDPFIKEFKPGTYRFKFALPGYRPSTSTVDVTGFQTIEVSATLERMEPAPAVDVKGPRPGEEWTNGLGMTLVYVPAGSFEMGSPPGEGGHTRAEGPERSVAIGNGFWIGKHEVAQAQWLAVMGTNPSRFRGPRRPVEQVSWQDCKIFCRRLSLREEDTYRLPTEAEWEYACRAGTKTAFSFGATITSNQANFDGTSPYNGARKGEYRKRTTDVGSFPANAFGLHDMHGNVWEWCLDRWHADYRGAPTDGSAWKEGRHKGLVVRGGSWYNAAKYARSASRRTEPADRGHDSFGLRVVVSHRR